jgi:hypothetical protein
MIERSDVVEDGRVTQVELSGYPPLFKPYSAYL